MAPRLPSNLLMRMVDALGWAVSGCMMFLPNVDTFMAQYADDSLFNGFGVIDPERLSRWYGLIVLIGLAPFCSIRLRDSKHDGRLVLIAFICGVTAIWAAAVTGAYGEHGLAYALRSPEVVGFYVFAEVIILVAATSTSARNIVSFFIGATVAQVAKLGYTIYISLTSGVGAVTVLGVRSLQGDGATLATQALIGCILAVAAVQALRDGRPLRAVFALSIAALMLGGVALSFRRLALVKALVSLLLTAIIAGYFERRIIASVLGSLAVFGAAIASAFIAGIAYFGEEVFVERLRSLSITALKGSGSSYYDTTNSDYLDHWNRWPNIVEESYGAGFGVDSNYNGLGPVDPVTGLPIPLHVGSFELVASLGVVGVVIWATILIGAPLYGLGQQRNSAKVNWIAVCVATWLLVTALFPFGAPFYYSVQQVILVGCCIGFIINVSRLPGRTSGNARIVHWDSRASFAST